MHGMSPVIGQSIFSQVSLACLRVCLKVDTLCVRAEEMDEVVHDASLSAYEAQRQANIERACHSYLFLALPSVNKV